MNGERLAPAVHPAANLRPAERPLYGHRNAQADVPVSGGCIDVGLEIRWQHHVHASVARANRPTGSHFGTRQDTRIHAAVPGLDVQRVEASCDSDLAVARIRLDLSVDITRFDGPISGAQPDISLQAVHYNAPVIRVQINGAVDLHTNDGGIVVDRLKGDIRLRTGDGSIEARDIDGKVEADSGDGQIRIAGRFDALNVKTGDGSVDTRVLPGSKMASSWTIRTGDGSG